MVEEGLLTWRVYSLLLENRITINNLASVYGYEKYPTEKKETHENLRNYEVRYSASGKLQKPDKDMNINKFVIELSLLTSQGRLKWVKDKASKKKATNQNVGYVLSKNDILSTDIHITYDKLVNILPFSKRQYSTQESIRLYNCIIRSKYLEKLGRILTKYEKRSVLKVNSAEAKKERTKMNRIKQAHCYELIDEYRNNDKYDVAFLDRVKVAIDSFTENDGRQFKKIIAYCTIKPNEKYTHKIIITETGEYLKLDDDFFVWGKNKALAEKCLDSIQKQKKKFYNGTYEYEIVESIILNREYLSQVRSVDARVRNPISKQREINKLKYVYVFLKLNNSCVVRKHDVESVTMHATDIINNKEIEINAYYCRDCEFYFINYEALKGYIDKKIIPQFKYRIIGNSIYEMNAVSELMLYGYTVRDGVLTEYERHQILKELIDSNIMTKYEIIRNLESKVDFNGQKAGNELAKKKWQDDIVYVSTYVNGNDRDINGFFWRF